MRDRRRRKRGRERENRVKSPYETYTECICSTNRHLLVPLASSETDRSGAEKLIGAPVSRKPTAHVPVQQKRDNAHPNTRNPTLAWGLVA